MQNIFEKFYEKLHRSMKFLIKNLQISDKWAKEFCVKYRASTIRKRKHNRAWFINQENLIKHENKLYASENTAVKEKLIRKNHNNSLIDHFEVKKTLKLIQRKYYWIIYEKQIKQYVKFCDIYQRMKASRHRSYDELKFLSVLTKSWKNNIYEFCYEFVSKQTSWSYIWLNFDDSR